MTDLDEQLERRQANGEITTADADTIRDFASFLRDPSSRCCICLTDDAEGAAWRKDRRLGRLFVCRTCAPAS